ncbi:hypothetical protein [Saccharicrinis fermentans]|uniref:Adhesin domain-containing protein n=1 Tax=Saccharicrinis fermentans DSM 9555 = JCM 21142 TaxID=869213 RepID=W7YGB3_9BACT|nr:hypothetical protein [Saccharicrinis fermentans]GAF03481.1 hypothetical protein JCM21142_52157 [Saccharicrinis fermentans DSM 9555 = JCM 21142]
MRRIKTILIAILTSWISLSSQDRSASDFTSYSLEVFPLHNITQLDVRAKHAQVDLVNWDKDSISVEASIEIYSDKPNLAKEMMNEIKLKTVGYSNTLLVKTSLVKDFNRTIPYKIKYTIFFPKKLGLRIENMHGRVNLEGVHGGVFANISYCDIQFGKISADTSKSVNHINLLHCNGIIKSLGSSDIEINNSTIEIQEADHINAITKYSLLKIGRIKDYQGSSQVDNIKIKAGDFVTINSNNSIINVQNFTQKALFEGHKGSLMVSHSGGSFRELTINNEETPTTVKIDSNTSYLLNGEVFNGKFTHTHKDQLKVVTDLNKIGFSGVVGKDPNTQRKVIIFNKNQKVEFN